SGLCTQGAVTVSACGDFLLVGAIAGSWADFRVIAAGVGAPLIDGAQAGLAIQVEAVTVGQTSQGEGAVFLIEVFDDAGLGQSPGNALGRLFALECIDQLQADQVVNAHLYRQCAARCAAVVAQTTSIARPGFQAIRVGRSD